MNWDGSRIRTHRPNRLWNECGAQHTITRYEIPGPNQHEPSSTGCYSICQHTTLKLITILGSAMLVFFLFTLLSALCSSPLLFICAHECYIHTNLLLCVCACVCVLYRARELHCLWVLTNGESMCACLCVFAYRLLSGGCFYFVVVKLLALYERRLTYRRLSFVRNKNILLTHATHHSPSTHT